MLGNFLEIVNSEERNDLLRSNITQTTDTLIFFLFSFLVVKLVCMEVKKEFGLLMDKILDNITLITFVSYDKREE
eukprot:CAMPEP_0170564474 /NCGR_PEP_ID=MMETSP0211-20121228/73066_1 /TAXON_ID=311385 /ORGANISM="Pseudokeronopsis sp., Strain OXSARD2" /LENGTH=74 /DNA_ID=CAMNT_0010883963 /DNA_START=336 /DNA_END=557 /DNA_ORIENTATION=-